MYALAREEYTVSDIQLATYPSKDFEPFVSQTMKNSSRQFRDLSYIRRLEHISTYSVGLYEMLAILVRPGAVVSSLERLECPCMGGSGSPERARSSEHGAQVAIYHNLKSTPGGCQRKRRNGQRM